MHGSGRVMNTIGKAIRAAHAKHRSARDALFFAELPSNTTRYNWHDTSRITFRKSTQDPGTADYIK